MVASLIMSLKEGAPHCYVADDEKRGLVYIVLNYLRTEFWSINMQEDGSLEN